MMASPSHLLLSVVAGRAAQRNRTLRWGNNVPTFSVGRGGDWCVSAPGVADAHVFLAFDGTRLRIASVSPRSEVKVHGAALPPSWTELTLPAEIQFGEARVRARQVFHASANLATTQHVDLHALAPLLRATLPHVAPAESAMVETVCDGGALRAEALRLQAQAAQKAATRHTALRWLRQLSLRPRQLALAALGACAALVLTWRLLHARAIPETAIAAEALPQPSPAPPPATDVPLVPLPELPPATPELQRDALRAALNGDERATELYQRLAAGPDARTFQLAARLSSRGHIRKP
jgi:hypothetical protein